MTNTIFVLRLAESDHVLCAASELLCEEGTCHTGDEVPAGET